MCVCEREREGIVKVCALNKKNTKEERGDHMCVEECVHKCVCSMCVCVCVQERGTVCVCVFCVPNVTMCTSEGV